ATAGVVFAQVRPAPTTDRPPAQVPPGVRTPNKPAAPNPPTGKDTSGGRPTLRPGTFLLEQDEQMQREVEAKRQQFRQQVEDKIAEQPHEALYLLLHVPQVNVSHSVRLGVGEALLTRPERVTLARQALDRLVVRAEANPNLPEALLQVRRTNISKDHVGSR